MKLTIYKGQYGYSTICKNKNRDGSEIKCYLNVQFKRGLEPSGEKTYIEVEDAFFSCYADRDGNIIPKLVVMAWYPDIRDEYDNGYTTSEITTVEEKQTPSSIIEIDTDDLPF